jgi:hypothetical protein
VKLGGGRGGGGSLTVVLLGCASPGRFAACVAAARRQPAFPASWVVGSCHRPGSESCSCACALPASLLLVAATANRSQRRAMAACQAVRVRAALARVRRHYVHAVLGVELDGFYADAGWARRCWLRLRLRLQLRLWLQLRLQPQLHPTVAGAAGCSRFLPALCSAFLWLSLHPLPKLFALRHPPTGPGNSSTSSQPHQHQHTLPGLSRPPD